MLASSVQQSDSDYISIIEENNRIENTRDIFKKIRDTKGIFHSKMGPTKAEMLWT